MNDDDYKIESDIPLPSRIRGKKALGKISKALDSLEVGQSFLIPDRAISRISGYYSNSRVRAKKEDRPIPKFSARTIGNDIRVWRIE